MLRKRWPALRFSSVYRTAPVEVEEQPAFLNAVGIFETEESPTAIQQELRTIEQSLGKSPPFRFGPRTIDLDLLLYGDVILQGKELMIPHPKMHERRFVLGPLCELIEPAALHPVLRESWQILLNKTEDQVVSRTRMVL